MACPQTLTSSQLRELATKGFVKQEQPHMYPKVSVLNVESDSYFEPDPDPDYEPEYDRKYDPEDDPEYD